MFKEYLFDAVGSCIVEKTGEYMENLLQRKIGKLMHT